MMKYEFEQLAGYEVTDEVYDKVIEPMYMSVDCDKLEFVKMLDKKYFALPTEAELMKQLKSKAQEIFELCGHTVTHEQEDELHKVAIEYCRRFYNSIPILEYGERLGCSYVKSFTVYHADREIRIKKVILI